MINYQSKQIVIDALIKVINAAPGLYSQRNYLYHQTYQKSDISMQEFNTWVDYANQILDISYNHIGYNAILTTKIAIGQLSSQHGASFIQRVDQIKRELLNLAQLILQYQ